MIKTVKVRLYPTASKLGRLKGTIEDFTSSLKTAIDYYWENPLHKNILRGRIGNDACRLARQIIKGAKKKNGSKPEIRNKVLVLNQFSGKITGRQTREFDLWFSIIDTRNKRNRILIPGKRTQHLNNLLSSGYQLRKTLKIKLKGKKVFAYLFLYKEDPPLKKEGEVLGLDIGYRKLFALSNGQFIGDKIAYLIERFYKRNIRCPRTIRHYINRCLKEITFEKLKAIVIERLKNLKKGKRGQWYRDINRRFNSWLYGYAIKRLEELCRENGVYLYKVNPNGTSRTCPICQYIEPKNRSGEIFRCLKCGYKDDADYVGALNILNRFLFLQQAPSLCQNV